MNRSRVALLSLVGTYVTLGAQIAVTLTVVPFAVSNLGATEYGRWVGLSSIAGWAALADLGIGGMLNFHLSQFIEKQDFAEAARYLWHGLLLAVVSGILAFMVLGVAATAAIWAQPDSFRLSDTPLVAAFTIAAAVPMMQLGNALAALQQAQCKPLTNAAVSIAAALGSLAVSVFLLPSLGATALALGQLIRGTVFVGALAILNTRFLHEHLVPVRVSREAFKPFLVTGVTGVANRWLQGLLVTYDAFSVSAVCGPNQVALYANTARPAGIATGLASAFGPAIMPLFSRLSATRTATDALRVYVTCVRLVLAICAALAMGFVVSYKPVIAAWVGAEYVLPPRLVAVIAMAAGAQAWLGFATYLFGGSGHFLPANKLLLIEGLLRGVLMTAGVVLGGIFGLAVVLAATQTVAVVCCVGLLARVTSVPAPWNAIATIAAEAAAVGCLLAAAAQYSGDHLRLVDSLLAGAVASALLLLIFTCREGELRGFLIGAVKEAIRPSK